MTSPLRSTTEVVGAMRKEIQQKHVTFLAGSIAYHAFISLLPLLLLAFVFFAAIGNENLQTQVISHADSLSPAIGDLVEAAIEFHANSYFSILVLEAVYNFLVYGLIT